MALDIKINTKRLEKILKTSPQELDRVMPGVGLRIGRRFLGYFSARRLRGPPGVRGTREGIRKQFSVDVTGSKFNNLRVNIFSTSPVVRLHEFGGVTRAKKGKFLAVPLSNLSKAQKNSARRLLRQTRNVRQAESEGFELRTAKGRKVKSLEIFAVKSKSTGATFLAQRVGKRLKVLFHLQKSVRNKPLLGFRLSWRQFRPNAIKLFNQGIGFALAAARKKAGAVREAA